MNHKKPLQPHEIRVIKLDHKTILETLFRIVGDISSDKFRLPLSNGASSKYILDYLYDEDKCELLLVAHKRTCEIEPDKMKEIPIEAKDSVLTRMDGMLNDYQEFSIHKHTAYAMTKPCWRNMMGIILDKIGLRERPLGTHRIRMIRLSEQAITELLWEHFMETADEVMDMPPERTDDDIQTVYHMHIEGKFDVLTLFVMNLDEASDQAFIEKQKYCDQNIGFTTESYEYDKEPNECKYISVMKAAGK